MRDKPTSETAWALQHNTPPHRLLTVTGKPVDEARNELVRHVLAVHPKPDVVVWADADSFWFPDAIPSLLGALARYPEIDIVTGVYGHRAPFRTTLVWKRAGDPASFVRVGEDCPLGDVLQIGEAGFHMVAMRRGVLDQIGESPFSVADLEQGEDTAFFARAHRAGIVSGCHTGVRVAHVGDDGCAYLPGAPRYAVRFGNLVPMPTPRPAEGSRLAVRTRDYGPAVNDRLDAASALYAGAA